MGHVGDEPLGTLFLGLQLFDGGLQGGGGFIEVTGEVGQLAGALGRHSRAQVAGSQLPDPAGELAQRPEHR